MSKTYVVIGGLLIILAVILVIASTRYNCTDNVCKKAWFGLYSTKDSCEKDCAQARVNAQARDNAQAAVIGYQCVQTPNNYNSTNYNCLSVKEGQPHTQPLFTSSGDCASQCKPQYVAVDVPIVYGGGWRGPRWQGGWGGPRWRGGWGGRGGWRGRR